MQLQCSAGWLLGVEKRESPNYSERPPNTTIDLIVVHGISLPPGEFGGQGVRDLFLNQLDPSAHPYYATIQGLRVSSHLVIDRFGRLTQYVGFQNSAWHAGASSWLGRSHCNDYSIGIELEGGDTIPYTPMQYNTLVAVARTLMQQYTAITPTRIVGHSDIAPGRKTDPGPAFDWDYFRNRLLLQHTEGAP